MPLEMNHDVFITCAVTGSGGTQDRSPHVPRSPAQIAESAYVRQRAVESGERYDGSVLPEDIHAVWLDRVRGGDPGTGTFPGLPPEAQRSQPLRGTLPSQHIERPGQRLLGRADPLQPRLRQPAQQAGVAEPAPQRRQEHDGSRIFAGQRHAFGSDLAVRYDCAGADDGNGIGF